jgi:hypothetical protein
VRRAGGCAVLAKVGPRLSALPRARGRALGFTEMGPSMPDVTTLCSGAEPSPGGRSTALSADLRPMESCWPGLGTLPGQ